MTQRELQIEFVKKLEEAHKQILIDEEIERKNNEELNKQSRNYYLLNKEKYAEKRKANKEKRNESSKEYYHKNKEKIKEKNDAKKDQNRLNSMFYYRDNKEKILQNKKNKLNKEENI
jgi:hypothetical protein